MKYLKRIVRVIFWLAIIALLVAPLGMIVFISQEEMKTYDAPEAPEMQVLAVGGIAKSYVDSASELITVSGTFVSDTYAYMELEYEAVKNARWNITTGDQLRVDQVIGTTPQGDILSTFSGIVSQMHIAQSDCYIKVQLLSPVELSCRVDSRVLSILKKSKSMEVDGAKVTLTYVSQLLNPDGTTDVRIFIDSDKYTCGQVVNGLAISTGRRFDNVVMLLERCVYQKNGDGQYYVRKVTEDGVFIAEIPVEIIIRTDNEVGLSGIGADEYFDTGYKAVAGG